MIFKKKHISLHIMPLVKSIHFVESIGLQRKSSEFLTVET